MSTDAQPLVVTIVPTAIRVDISPVITTTEAQAVGRAVAGAAQTVAIKPA